MTEVKESILEGEGKIFKGPNMDDIYELMSKWQSLGHYFFHCLGERFPDEILFTDYESGRRWTGAQFRDKILSVACALIDKYDFKPGTVVCISYDSSDYALILSIAIICAGGVVACAYQKDPYAELLYLARKVEPKFLFCHNKNVAWINHLEQDLGYKIQGIFMDATTKDEQSSDSQIGHFSSLIDYDHTSSPARTKVPVACQDLRKELALIGMSSGTTGKPKAVAQTHRNILAELFGGRLNSEVDHSCAYPASLDYVSCRMIVFGAIHAGYHAIILNEFEPSTYLDATQKYRAQEIFAGPAHVYSLITHPRLDEYDISSVRSIIVGGAKLIFMDELRSFFERHPHVTTVTTAYGASEFGMAVMRWITPREYFADTKSCGKLLPGFQAKIVDPASGRLLGLNQDGILHVKGDTVFPGYYDKSLMRARQAAVNMSTTDNSCDDDNISPFVCGKDVFDDDGYYITGDYGYFSDKEELYIIGRLKEVMNCRNAKKVLPQELESIIDQHPAVDKVCVLGIANKRELTLHCPRAFVVPKSNYYDIDVVDSKLELGPRLSTLNDELNEDLQKEVLIYSGASEPKVCRMKLERRHLIVEDLMRFVNERVGWEKQLTGGIVLLDNIPTSRGTGKMDKNYLRTLSLKDIEIYGDRSG